MKLYLVKLLLCMQYTECIKLTCSFESACVYFSGNIQLIVLGIFLQYEKVEGERTEILIIKEESLEDDRDEPKHCRGNDLIIIPQNVTTKRLGHKYNQLQVGIGVYFKMFTVQNILSTHVL